MIMAFKRKLMAVGLAVGLTMTAMPVQAQPDAHQRTLNQLRQCRATQSATMAHLQQMARGGHDGPAHRATLNRLAQCRDYLTAALAHLDEMAREHR
jgi:hypothetical protein